MKRALIVLFVAALLTGCGGSDEPESDTSGSPTEQTAAAEVEAGTCLSDEVEDEGDKAPDLASVVECSEPHLYEVNAVVDLPDSLLSGESDEEKAAHRAELATPAQAGVEPSAAKTEYAAFADEACADAALDAVGWSGMSLQGVAADDAQLVPMALKATPLWATVMPEEAWLEGSTQLVCSTRFSEATLDGSGMSVTLPAAAAVSSPDGEPMISHFPDQAFGAELRACETAEPNGTRAYLPCDSDAHYAEFLFTYDARTVLGADFVNAVDPGNVSDPQYARLDQVCVDVLDELLPGYDTETFKGLAELGSQGWGADDAAYYQGQCTVAAKDSLNFNLPTGSLMGTDGAGVEPLPFE